MSVSLPDKIKIKLTGDEARLKLLKKYFREEDQLELMMGMSEDNIIKAFKATDRMFESKDVLELCKNMGEDNIVEILSLYKYMDYKDMVEMCKNMSESNKIRVIESGNLSDFTILELCGLLDDDEKKIEIITSLKDIPSVPLDMLESMKSDDGRIKLLEAIIGKNYDKISLVYQIYFRLQDDEKKLYVLKEYEQRVPGLDIREMLKSIEDEELKVEGIIIFKTTI